MARGKGISKQSKQGFKGDPKRSKLRVDNRNPSVSRAELAKQRDLSKRQIRKIIGRLRNAGKLKREGGKIGKWIITEE